MPGAKDNYKRLEHLLLTLKEQEQMDDFDRDLEGWLDDAVTTLVSIYGKESTPADYFRQINEAHLASVEDDGLIPKASENMTVEAARFHLEKFIKTFWDADARTDFTQSEHHKNSIAQDIAALEAQHLALNTGTLSSWLTTTQELIESRFGTHSTKYHEFAKLKESFDKEYGAERMSAAKETIKHDYFLRGRQKILAIINQLKSELEQMNTTQPMQTKKANKLSDSFRKITLGAWTIIITTFIAVVSGAYILGKDNGASKFDQQKINLERENEKLKEQQKNNDQIVVLIKDSLKLARDTIDKQHLKISGLIKQMDSKRKQEK